ncbi:hypothetical protein [Streptomyces sp. NPDC098781]|uniref:DUF7144 family membrane protein n=1 Tax=Streptomyces sp. NPDC098781 TaxID=3366097 RepID=UPI003810300A
MAAPQTRQAHTTKHAWAGGLTVFAAVMLTITGLIAIFRGIMGIAEDDVFVATRSYVFEFDLTGWGWVHLILGVVAVLIGIGLFAPTMWARIGGVAVAGLIIIANFLSLPYYPVWSVIMIAISGFVIWALCVARKDDFSA